MPQKYFVTRHHGAVQWAAEGGASALQVEMENFDPAVVQAGDIVMGTLPVHIAAEVNKRGGHYWHLSMEIPPEWRGQELSAEQMREFGARLHEFGIADIGLRVSAGPDVEHDSKSAARIHLCVASGQMLPNVLPLLALPWKRVIIFASRDMQASAERLVELLGSAAPSDPGAQGLCEVVAMPERLDWSSLQTFARTQAQDLAGQGPVDLNLTGDNKLMSLALAEAFRSHARLFYCSTETESLNIIDAVAQDSVALAPDLLNLHNYLDVQGYEVTRSLQAGERSAWLSQRQRQAITARLVLDTATLEQTAWTLRGREACLADTPSALHDVKALSTNINNLLGLLHHVGSEAVPKKHKDGRIRQAFRPWVLITDVIRQGAWATVFEGLEEAGVIGELNFYSTRDGARVLEFMFLGEAEAAYLGGGYLEEYVLLALAGTGLPAAQFAGSVGLGLQKGHQTRRNASAELNELDAAVVWRTRLLVIECKAGVQLMGAESQAIIHKLDQLKDNVGGSMGKAWLVTQRRITENSHPDVLQRADLNKLRIISGPDEMLRLGDAIASELGCDNASPWPASLGDDLTDFAGRTLLLPH